MVLKPANSPRRPDPSERPSFAFAIPSPESTASPSKPPKSPLQKLAKLAREDPPPTVTIRGLQVQYNVVKRNVLAAVVRISKMRSFVKGAIDKADAVQESCEIMMDNNPSISDGGSLAEAAAKGALRELKMWAALTITAMAVQDRELVNLQDQLASAAAFLDQEEEVMQPPKKMLGPDDGGRSPSPGPAKAGAHSQSPSGRASRMLRIAAAQVMAASPPRSPASGAGGHSRTMDRNLRVAAIQKGFIEATALANETRIACAEAQKVAREHQSMIERQRSLLGKAGKMLVISKGREHGAGALEVNEDAEISNPTDEEPYSPSPSGLVEGLLGTNRPISEPRRPGFSPSTVVMGSTDKPTSEIVQLTVRSGRSERETVRSGRLPAPLRPGRLPAPPPVAVQDEDDEDAGSASKKVSRSNLPPLPMMDLDSVDAERAPAPTSAAIAGMEAPAEPTPASHVRDEEAEQAVEAEAQPENDESEGQSSPERAAQEQVEDEEGEEGEEEGEEEGDEEGEEEGEEEGIEEDGEEGEGDAFDEGAARAAAQEMDISELEAALAEFGIVPSGDKEALVEQLVEAQAATAANEEEEADEFDEEVVRTAAQKMDVAELEAAIAEYGLEPSGDKDELVEQLLEAQAAAHEDGIEDGSDAGDEPIGGLPG
jgi:hypothetical protein